MNYNIFFSKKLGFTLIELLVAIGIIALLTAVITANFSDARAKSRDAKRISDMAQIQLALTYYFDRCNQYPLNLSLEANNGCPVNINLGTFLGKYPLPPTAGGDSNPNSSHRRYNYFINSSNSPTDYFLVAYLENNSHILQDGLTFSGGMFFPSSPNQPIQSSAFPPIFFLPSSSLNNCGQSDGQNMYRYCVGSK
jgi:prepilin-type N-terminal cleavage/methylation domain-containing protein